MAKQRVIIRTFTGKNIFSFITNMSIELFFCIPEALIQGVKYLTYQTHKILYKKSEQVNRKPTFL